MKKAERKAYAKINLTLEIGEKRCDGYHLLVSVMARASLFDTLEVSENSLGTTRVFASDPALNTKDNLCIRAAEGYFALTGIKKGVDIKLQKNIPVASGLGGGSADCAATIDCLEELFQPLSDSQRHSLALSLGADVPYCLKKTPCLCTGIGDKCEELDLSPILDLYLNIIKVGTKLSTGKVYEAFDALEKSDTPHNHQIVIDALKNGDAKALTKGLFNDFERVVFPELHEVKALREKLLNSGADAVLMSGAGPALVAFYTDEEKARQNGEVYKILM